MEDEKPKKKRKTTASETPAEPKEVSETAGPANDEVSEAPTIRMDPLQGGEVLGKGAATSGLFTKRVFVF